MIKKRIANIIGGSFAFSLFALSSLLFSTFVLADQYGQYNGTTTPPKIMIDKLVRHPKTGEYVDNLGLSDDKYMAENTVYFKIIVENTGGEKINQLKVVDFLPPFLKYVTGGSYDPTNRQITFYFDNLLAGERRSTILQTKVVSLKEMPLAKSVLCPVNKVVATANDILTDEDTAQLCIERKVMVASVPKTGDPTGLLFALSSIPTLIFGLKMRKRA